ncbi:hypothetical protein [Streptomyces sp. NPDC001139]
MSRRINARLERIEQAMTPPSDVPMCAYHGGLCGLGERTRDSAEWDLYVLIVEAQRRAGQDVPPLDEHRVATPAEAAEYRRGYEEALAAAKAKNAQMEAEILGGQDHQ